MQDFVHQQKDRSQGVEFEDLGIQGLGNFGVSPEEWAKGFLGSEPETSKLLKTGLGFRV